MTFAPTKFGSRSLRWGVLLLAWIMLAIGLWHSSRAMAPVKEIHGDDYWKRVLRLGDSCGRAYLPRDGWFIGARSGFHGEFLFRVPESEAREAFGDFAAKMEGFPPCPIEYLQKGIDVWLAKDRDRSDPVLLLECIQQAHLDIYDKQPEMQEYVRSRETAFHNRWQRVNRYWLNIAFEGAFLGTLVLFLLWPWLRHPARWRWALHFGLLPILLFVPYYLGYGMLTFTTAAQPGGVLYSQILVRFRQPLVWLIGGSDRELPWTALDGWVMANLPKPLEPISQTPGDLMVISGGGGIGPVLLLKLGALLAATIYGGPPLLRIAKQHFTTTSSSRRTPPIARR